MRAVGIHIYRRMSEQPRKPDETGTEAPPGVDALSLVRRAQTGDGEAYAALAAAHQPALARFCRRLTGDAEAGADLAQETLLRAQQSVTRLGEPYRFGPWLFGIAANLAKKLWRAEARRPLSLESLLSGYPHIVWDESHTVTPSPERRSEVAEELRLLADAIAALPPALSRVVVLHYLDGLNYAAVAGALDVPVSTVKGRLFESRARLRDHLGDLREVHGPSARTNGAGIRNGRTHANNPGDARDADNGGAPMSKISAGTHIRIEIDVERVVDEAHRFVTQHWPHDDPDAVLDELGSSRNRFVPLSILEHMVLEGVSKRADVDSFVSYCFGDWGIGEPTVPAATPAGRSAVRRKDPTMRPLGEERPALRR